MKIAVINSGSSSLKFKLFVMPRADIIAYAHIENIGKSSKITFGYNGREYVIKSVIASHKEGLQKLNGILHSHGMSFSSLDAVSHRVVHAGESGTEAAFIDDTVTGHIKEFAPLAPLHNGANLQGIELCAEEAPDVMQIAVFDTAFHASMPQEAYMYALPYELYEKYKIRRYGFHGISHSYVMKEAAKFIGKEPRELNMITLHLGAGCSACAIQGGISIDTSMGFTPLEGLVMRSRSGDIDPSVVLYLQRELGYGIDDIEELLDKRSGLVGIAGEGDFKELQNRNDPLAKLAVDISVRRIKKYIGSYAALLGRVDVVVFTGGIGENSSLLRKKVLQNLEYFGIVLDSEANTQNRKCISTLASKAKVLVVKTDEELEIAQESYALLTKRDF